MQYDDIGKIGGGGDGDSKRRRKRPRKVDEYVWVGGSENGGESEEKSRNTKKTKVPATQLEELESYRPCQGTCHCPQLMPRPDLFRCHVQIDIGVRGIRCLLCHRKFICEISKFTVSILQILRMHLFI